MRHVNYRIPKGPTERSSSVSKCQLCIKFGQKKTNIIYSQGREIPACFFSRRSKEPVFIYSNTIIADVQ